MSYINVSSQVVECVESFSEIRINLISFHILVFKQYEFLQIISIAEQTCFRQLSQINFGIKME